MTTAEAQAAYTAAGSIGALARLWRMSTRRASATLHSLGVSTPQRGGKVGRSWKWKQAVKEKMERAASIEQRGRIVCTTYNRPCGSHDLPGACEECKRWRK